MKRINILFGIATMVFFSACTSLEKMVERGDYDEAIVKVAKRISGKKNKSTRDIKILEAAFKKITEEDLANAAYLKNMGRASSWDDVYNTYDRIEERQELIRPFLPLVSKDGYRARFQFADVFELKKEAAEQATAFNYNEAIRLLDVSKKDYNKSAARKAYDALVQIEKYTDRYKDSEHLREEARFLGTNRVLVTLENNTFGFMPREVEEEIMNVNVKELNTFWTKYYTQKTLEHDYDMIARLNLDRIDISPERELVDRYRDTKEIKDGWEYVLDEKGNVMKDSLGNDIKKDRFITVVADVVEIHRTKAALASGRLGLFDAYTGELIESRPFNVEANFSSYASSFQGDRRALCDRSRNRLRGYPERFPSDLAMSLDVAHNLKEIMKDELRRFNI